MQLCCVVAVHVPTNQRCTRAKKKPWLFKIRSLTRTLPCKPSRKQNTHVNLSLFWFYSRLKTIVFPHGLGLLMFTSGQHSCCGDQFDSVTIWTQSNTIDVESTDEWDVAPPFSKSKLLLVQFTAWLRRSIINYSFSHEFGKFHKFLLDFWTFSKKFNFRWQSRPITARVLIILTGRILRHHFVGRFARILVDVPIHVNRRLAQNSSERIALGNDRTLHARRCWMRAQKCSAFETPNVLRSTEDDNSPWIPVSIRHKWCERDRERESHEHHIHWLDVW